MDGKTAQRLILAADWRCLVVTFTKVITVLCQQSISCLQCVDCAAPMLADQYTYHLLVSSIDVIA